MNRIWGTNFQRMYGRAVQANGIVVEVDVREDVPYNALSDGSGKSLLLTPQHEVWKLFTILVSDNTDRVIYRRFSRYEHGSQLILIDPRDLRTVMRLNPTWIEFHEGHKISS